MYKDIFTQLGLNSNEAIVYEYLLQNGESPAGQIIKKTPLKRGVVYNALTDLIKKGLMTEKKKKKVAYFSPNHPEKLRDFVKSKTTEIEKAEKTLEANLPKIIADFTLISSRPGVQYFEGKEGLKKILADTLTAKEVIYTFADVEATVKYMGRINKEYAQQRWKLKVNKKIITTDSPFARKYIKNYYKDVTEFRFIEHSKHPFSSLMQIYDGKVAYISLSSKEIISMLITDKNIYKMNKTLFEFIWFKAKAFQELTPLSKAQ